jgi:uncharacterized protein YjbJ (UPF0337 family)
MNKDIIGGKWEQLKGKARTQWAKLTNDDIDQVKGDAQTLAGRLQERYGWAREQAEREITDWLAREQPHTMPS